MANSIPTSKERRILLGEMKDGNHEENGRYIRHFSIQDPRVSFQDVKDLVIKVNSNQSVVVDLTRRELSELRDVLNDYLEADSSDSPDDHGDNTEPDESTEGWGVMRPGDRRYHYYVNGFSLCGRVGFYFGELSPDTANPCTKDCAACRKILTKRGKE